MKCQFRNQTTPPQTLDVKSHPDLCHFFVFVSFVVVAMLLQVPWALSADAPSVTANDAGPSQDFHFHIGKCHLDPKNASVFSGGRPEVRITYTHAGIERTWTSAASYPNAKGLDFSFNADLDLPLDLDYKAQIHILLVDVGTVWNNTIIDKSFPVLKVREDLARGRLTANLSWIELVIADLPGRYEVELERTCVSAEDFEALGGTLPKELQSMNWWDWLRHPKDSAKQEAANLLQMIKESIEKCDHEVIVEQNGRAIFDSRDFSKPQGLVVVWDAKATFEINWKPGDKISIRFQDHHTLKPNSTILEQSDNSDSSISLLKGPTPGGKHGQSIVLFRAHHLQG